MTVPGPSPEVLTRRLRAGSWRPVLFRNSPVDSDVQPGLTPALDPVIMLITPLTLNSMSMPYIALITLRTYLFLASPHPYR